MLLPLCGACPIGGHLSAGLAGRFPPPPYRISPANRQCYFSDPSACFPPALAGEPERLAEAERGKTGHAMARVHEKTEFSVSVIGCGRMGCAIAGRAPLSRWGGCCGGSGDYWAEGECEGGDKEGLVRAGRGREGEGGGPGSW